MPLRCFLLAFLFTLIIVNPARASDAVGFQQTKLADGTETGVWYPATGTPEPMQAGIYRQAVVTNAPAPRKRHPLVVMSHGSGGHFAGHFDTALALARAGFIVAALTHPGDNWRDRSRATDVAQRPLALKRLIDFMLSDWPGSAAIDTGRIGAFGFSAGGFTVLAAAGGRPDLTRVRHHCAAHPAFYDCRLIAAAKAEATSAWEIAPDRRLRAIVVAAPALGFTFDRTGLSGVRIPVQLWRADDDAILPAPFYADAVRRNLPKSPEFHAVTRAGHFDFLAPCDFGGPLAMLCTSAPGFDRTAFHKSFNANVVRFFHHSLKAATGRRSADRAKPRSARRLHKRADP